MGNLSPNPLFESKSGRPFGAPIESDPIGTPLVRRGYDIFGIEGSILLAFGPT